MGKNEEKDSMYVFNLKFKILKTILLICAILIPVLALLETVSVSKRQAVQLDKAKLDSQNQLEQMSTMVTESVNAITKIDNQISQINIGSEVSTSAISKIGENIGNLNMSIGDLVKNQKTSTESSNL